MRIGTLVDRRFELQARAGAGAMGEVFRALDRATGSTVALKIAHGWGSEDAARFAREVAVLASLEHPATVRYVAHGETAEGQRYLAMEWLDGEPLSARLKRGAIDVDSAIALGARLAGALGEAHRAGITHRDVKPGNVMLRGGELAMATLVDFGIARVPTVPGTKSLTQTGAMLGTPGYMPPEQSRGEKTLDARADIFSLGCVLYQCVTGRAPFAGDDLLGTLLKVVFEEPPAPSSLAAVPRWLDRLIARAMSKAPEDRFADGVELAHALARGDTAGPPAEPSPKRSALGHAELKAQCLLLVRSREPAEQAARRALDLAVRAQEGELLQLADGSMVASFGGAGSAREHAARAARAAAAGRAALAGCAVAIVTGRLEAAERAPVGEIIERGLTLLNRSSARGGQVALDEVSAGLLAGLAAGTGPLAREPEGSFLLDLPSAAQATRAPALPFVGRGAELAALERLFDEVCHDGRPRVALVTARAGAGKSRLLFEFLRRLASRGEAAIWKARADAMSAGAPLGLLADLMRSATLAAEAQPLASRRSALRHRVSTLVPATEVERVSAFLGLLIGTPPGEALVEVSSAETDPVLMGDQIRRACVDVLAAEAQSQPLVIVLEDLHWGDLASVKFFEQALKSAGDRPWLLVAVARPEIDQLFPALWSAAAPLALELGPLPHEACEQLARRMLSEAADAAVVGRVVELAAGNAFFLEELLRTVASGNQAALPETALAMAEARLDVLPEEVRRVLRGASVFGGTFWREGVVALIDDAALVDRALDELVEGRIVERRASSRLAGASELCFRHALLRDAAYSLLTEADRALAHRLAGEWLEGAGEHGTIVLAEHFARAGFGARAALWFRRAAAQAIEGNDFEAALRLADRGIEAHPDRPLLGGLWLIQAEAHRWRGEWAKTAEKSRAAAEVLEAGDAQWVRAVCELAAARGRLGDVESTRRSAVDLLALGQGGETSGPFLIGVCRVAIQLFRHGDHALGGQLLGLVEPREEELLRHAPAVAIQLCIARAIRANVVGEDAAGMLQASLDGVKLCEQTGDHRTALVNRANVGAACTAFGLYEQAAQAMRASLEDGERMGVSVTAPTSLLNLGIALAGLGRYDEAQGYMARALDLARGAGDRRLVASVRSYWAKLHCSRGAWADAERTAREALADMEPGSPRRPLALAALAEALLYGGRAAEAEEPAREALEHARSGAVTAESAAFSRLVAAEVQHALGHLARAKHVIHEARTRLLEGAARIPRADWRASYLANVRDHARILALAGAWLGEA